MIDRVSYDRVLEVRERKVGAGQVLPDRAHPPCALGRKLVDDPRLRVGTRLWRATRYGGVASVEREVDPPSLLDDHVVLPAVEHDVAPHHHAPQLFGIRDRRALRPQGIVSATARIQECIAIYRQGFDPGAYLIPGHEPERIGSLAHVVDHRVVRIEALEPRAAYKPGGLITVPAPDGQSSCS